VSPNGTGPATLAKPMLFLGVPSRSSASATPATRPRPPKMSTPPRITAVTMNTSMSEVLSTRADWYWPM
jgi:hypothetical protein